MYTIIISSVFLLDFNALNFLLWIPRPVAISSFHCSQFPSYIPSYRLKRLIFKSNVVWASCFSMVYHTGSLSHTIPHTDSHTTSQCHWCIQFIISFVYYNLYDSCLLSLHLSPFLAYLLLPFSTNSMPHFDTYEGLSYFLDTTD